MGIFDNATSVVINNKEVQSIVITSNNAVIYQKSSSSSKIATEMVFIRKLTDGISTYVLQDINGNYIGGKTITIYKNGIVWTTMTSGAKNGVFVMYTDSGYVAVFNGDDTYDGCTLTM